MRRKGKGLRGGAGGGDAALAVRAVAAAETRHFERALAAGLSYYLNELERQVLCSKFSFWGAMRFDKSRQRLQAYFGELTSSSTRSIRDQFVRIRCVAEILQFSKLSEAKHYLKDDHFVNAADQALTADEIKKLLSLRTEFNSLDVHARRVRHGLRRAEQRSLHLRFFPNKLLRRRHRGVGQLFAP